MKLSLRQLAIGIVGAVESDDDDGGLSELVCIAGLIVARHHSNQWCPARYLPMC
jgi:hypothetical protein